MSFVSVAEAARQAATDPKLAAIIGIVVGGMLTILGDVAIRLQVERRDFRRLRRALHLEIAQIYRICRERSAVNRQHGIPPQTPLSTVVWNQAVVSGELMRIRGHEQLMRLYQVIGDANYLSSQAPYYVLIANLAVEPTVRRSYADEVTTLTRDPYVRVLEEIDQLRQSPIGNLRPLRRLLESA
jgi:hypothetical protein